MNCNQRTRLQGRTRAARVGVGFVLVNILVACSSLPETEPSRTLTTWTIDPEFSVGAVDDPETKAWYRQIGVEIAREHKIVCPPETTLPSEYPAYPSSGTRAACSTVKHYVGRGLNFYVSSLLTVFRLSGDPALLAEVDRVMEIARSRLRDTDADGYRNWSYLPKLDNDDFNLKEDSLSHGFIAQVAYVFRQNATQSSAKHNYSAHADAWITYLRQDFEGKWKDRHATRQTQGMPVSPLFHPFMEVLRYNVYMAKLFPEEPKYRELSERLSGIALAEFKTDMTPKGEAFVWSHFVRQWREDGTANLCLDFQMGTYPQQTMTVFTDLALEGYPGFSDTLAMQKLSRTLSESIMTPTRYAFLYKDVGGLRNGTLDVERRKKISIEGWCFVDARFSAGVTPTDNFRSESSYQALPWGFLAAFSTEAETALETSEIYRANQQIYGNPLDGDLAPKAIYIPAAMAFARLYTASNFSLAR